MTLHVMIRTGLRGLVMLGLVACVRPTLEGRRCEGAADCVEGFRCAASICTPFAENPPASRILTDDCERFIGADATGPIDPQLIGSASAVIVIGSILPLTRGGAPDPVMEAREAAIALGLTEINRNGGIRGRKIVGLSCNSDGDSAVALRVARHIAAAGISVVVGEQSSSRTLEIVQDVLIPAGVMTIAPSATSVDLTSVNDEGLLVRTTVSDASQGTLLGRQLANLGSSRVTVLAAADSYGSTLSEKLQQVWCATGPACSSAGAFTVIRFNADDIAAVDVASVVAGAPDTVVFIGEVPEVKALLGAIGPALPDAHLVVTDTARRPDLFAAPALPASTLERLLGTAPAARGGETANLLASALSPEHRSASFVGHAYDAAVVAGLLYATAPDDIFHPSGRRLAGGLPRLTTGVKVATIGATNGVRDVATAISALEVGDSIDLEGVSGPLDFDDNGDVSGDLELWRVCTRSDAATLVSLGTALSADGTFTSLDTDCSCLLPELSCGAGDVCLQRLLRFRCLRSCAPAGADCTIASGAAGVCTTLASGELVCLEPRSERDLCDVDSLCVEGRCIGVPPGQCLRLCGTGPFCSTVSETTAETQCGCTEGDDCSSASITIAGNPEPLCTSPTAPGAPCSLEAAPFLLCSFPQRCIDGRCTAP